MKLLALLLAVTSITSSAFAQNSERQTLAQQLQTEVSTVQRQLNDINQSIDSNKSDRKVSIIVTSRLGVSAAKHFELASKGSMAGLASIVPGLKTGAANLVAAGNRGSTHYAIPLDKEQRAELAVRLTKLQETLSLNQAELVSAR